MTLRMLIISKHFVIYLWF